MEPTAQPNIRFAETNEDTIAIHKFLCIVSQPRLLCPIDALDSVTEVDRIVKDMSYGFALMAEVAGVLVGTIGVASAKWWYGKGQYFHDQWFFTADEYKNLVGPALLREAGSIAKEAKMDLIIGGKMRRKDSVIYARQQVIAGDTDVLR